MPNQSIWHKNNVGWTQKSDGTFEVICGFLSGEIFAAGCAIVGFDGVDWKQFPVRI